jgi:hypothetical protein
MNNVNSLVLITLALKPPEGIYLLKMTNAAKRIITAKAAVFFWAALGVKKIVIADATGQTLLDDSELSILNQMDIDIEQIQYLQDNELVIKQGKGYGEGALIKFALQNSKFLQNTNNFFKCTGKVYCRNFLEIFNMIQKNNIQNIFWRDIFNNSMDTRFFYVSKDFSEKFLIPAYETIDDRKHIYSEHCVMKMARQHMTRGVSIRPMLSGFSGSLNHFYFDSSLGFLDRNLPCWLSK